MEIHNFFSCVQSWWPHYQKEVTRKWKGFDRQEKEVCFWCVGRHFAEARQLKGRRDKGLRTQIGTAALEIPTKMPHSSRHWKQTMYQKPNNDIQQKPGHPESKLGYYINSANSPESNDWGGKTNKQKKSTDWGPSKPSRILPGIKKSQRLHCIWNQVIGKLHKRVNMKDWDKKKPESKESPSLVF